MRNFQHYKPDGTIEFGIEESPQKIAAMTSDRLGHSKFYRFVYKILPRRIRNKTLLWLIKHKLLKLEGGIFGIKVYNPDGSLAAQAICPNLIVDVGVQHLGDILVGVETTNITLDYLEPGEGTTAPVVGNTDIEDSLDPANRLAAGSQTRNASSPFEINIEAFVPTSEYTRPQTINEMAVFWGPDETGDMFARALLDSPIVLGTAQTATLNYTIVFR